MTHEKNNVMEILINKKASLNLKFCLYILFAYITLSLIKGNTRKD